MSLSHKLPSDSTFVTIKPLLNTLALGAAQKEKGANLNTLNHSKANCKSLNAQQPSSKCSGIIFIECDYSAIYISDIFGGMELPYVKHGLHSP